MTNLIIIEIILALIIFWRYLLHHWIRIDDYPTGPQPALPATADMRKTIEQLAVLRHQLNHTTKATQFIHYNKQLDLTIDRLLHLSQASSTAGSA